MGDDDDAVSNFGMSLRMRITAMARSESSGAVGSSAGSLGAIDQSARDGNRCCSPPESCGALRGSVHIKRREQFQCLRARLSIRGACKHRQQRHVVGDIEKRNQVWCLENETDLVAPQGASPVSSHRRNPFIAQRHATSGRFDHRTQTFEQRALAGPEE